MSDYPGIKSLNVIGHLDPNDTSLSDVDIILSDKNSIFQTPGPKCLTVRPYMAPDWGMGNITARILDGREQAEKKVIFIDKEIHVVNVPRSPLGAILRSDKKLWVLSNEGLDLVGHDGTLVNTVDVNGFFLKAERENTVWVIDEANKIAHVVNASGENKNSFEWKDGMNTVSDINGDLCRIEGGKIYRMTSSGKVDISFKLPSDDIYQSLLWCNDTHAITLEGATFLKCNRKGEVVNKVTIQSLGLTDKGKPFASGRDNHHVNLWYANGKCLKLKLAPSIPEKGAFSVTAVRKEEVLLFGQDYAAWYKNQKNRISFKVTDSNYREDIFAISSQMLFAPLTAVADNGNLILSTSSSTGMTLIEVGW
jgi:hypothetical protein